MKKILLPPLALLVAALAFSQTLKLPQAQARRVEVLFLGAPTANHPAHDPVERYRILRKNLGTAGIDFTYSEDLTDLRRDVLDRYDAVMMYGNWKQNEPMDPAQEKALLGFVEDGGAFLPIHCASACFGGSDAFVKLVGGRFKSHNTGVFKTTITAPDHPVMRGFEGFETWDETYVHDRHGDDRTILQRREHEPWTWVRKQGKGNVFYTAYGHDMRCWSQPSFHELLRRGILWSVGAEVRSKLTALKLPELEQEEMLLPGYRDHKAITSGQKPLPPEQSIKLAHVPTGFDVSLFACEPDIVNPIHIAWDHRGRAFVVETVDYPNNLQEGNIGHDRIRICEDTNGDGRADKFTLFADKLSIPTSVICVNGGVISTNGTQVIFLKDTNGDDKADERKVILDGFSMGDTHAGPSNLRYGFDNWIYATVGYSGFNGTVGGEHHKFSQGVFRFKADGSKLEFLQNTTNNTWGLGFTSDFDIMGSTANANPSWYFTFAKSLYQNAGIEPPRTPRADDNPLFFPSSTDIRQVDQFDRYTAAAGHGFYTAARFPETYRDRIAFVTEPTGKLVGQFDVTRVGAGYKARQLPNNLFDSADAWTSPVYAETGPDGAVWICDWYNLIVQHNPTPSVASAGVDFKTGKGGAYETPLRDVRYGRIYRVYPEATPDDANPKLDVTDPGTLIAGLSHPNLFWRQQAQRLLVETRSTSAIAKLKEIANTGSGAAAFHAFGALMGLDSLDQGTVAAALKSSHRGLRRLAMASPLSDGLLVSTFTRDGVLAAADDRELAELFAAIARLAPSDATGALLHASLVSIREKIAADQTLNDAWQIAARRHAKGVLLAASSAGAKPSAPVNLLPDPGFSEASPSGWKRRIYNSEKPDEVEMKTAADGRNGSPALMIRSANRADAGYAAEVTLKPDTRYRVGGWVRVENLENKGGRGAMFNVEGPGAATEAISGTKGWTELQTEFNSGNHGKVVVNCLFGGYGGSAGTAWWDDVYLQEIASTDVTSLIVPVAGYFAATAPAADRKFATDALAARTDPFAKDLLAKIAAVPADAAPKARKHVPDPAVHERGLAVYNKTCIACHGPEGKGVPQAFPPLDGSPWPVGDPELPIRIVLKGMQGPLEVGGQKFNNVMAPLGVLTDQEIADVLTYVRQSWGNDAPPVKPETVKKVRAKYADRLLPWNADELPHP